MVASLTARGAPGSPVARASRVRKWLVERPAGPYPSKPMEVLGLPFEALERIRLSRDARFDGRFFIAIASTGIYCRPICPAPHAKRSNVRYFETAAAAAEAGFRPCLRCRPEAAPGTPAWLGASAVVRRALRLIQEGALDQVSVQELANRLGVGPRQLHRLFVQHVGASPTTIAQTRRLHFAKRLLDETDLPITQVALAAAFGSVRRFNDCFRRTYGWAPRELRRLRRRGATADVGQEVVLRLSFRPPYDWPLVRDELARRAIPGVERIDARGYARTVASDGGHAVVRVRALPGQAALELAARGAAPSLLFQLSSAARRTFDLAADPARIGLAFQGDPLLAPLVRLRPGLRIPGAWDPFECAVRAALGERAGDAEASALLGGLVARLGRPVVGGEDGLTHLFPTPAALAAATLDEIGLGSRSAAVQALARTALDGLFAPGGPDGDAPAVAALPGLGDWAGQTVALRALGEPDAFPSADAVLRRAAGGPGRALTASELEARAESWRPWRAYAAMHLWSAAADGTPERHAHDAREPVEMVVAAAP